MCKIKLKKNAKVTEFNPTNLLLDENLIAKAIWECLKNNDPEGVIEVIKIHLETINKLKGTKSLSFKGKNPTIKSLAKFIGQCI